MTTRFAEPIRTRGRGGINFGTEDERVIFGAYLRLRVDENGGRIPFATQVGCKPASLSEWMNAKKTPSREYLDRLCVVGLFLADGITETDELVAARPWRRPELQRKLAKLSKRANGHPLSTSNGSNGSNGHKEIAMTSGAAPHQAQNQVPQNGGGIPEHILQGAPEPPPSIMDAILREPALTPKQRVQITAVVTMILAGIDLGIEIQPQRA